MPDMKRRNNLIRVISGLCAVILTVSICSVSSIATTISPDTTVLDTESQVSDSQTLENSEAVSQTEETSEESDSETDLSEPENPTDPPADTDSSESAEETTEPPGESETIEDPTEPTDTEETEPPLFMRPSTINLQSLKVYAETLYSLRLRSAPTTNSTALMTIGGGVTVDVLNDNVETTDDPTYVRWVQVRYTPLGGQPVEGYLAHDYLRIWTVSDEDELPPPMTPAEFEAHLTAQGFPESYKPALRALYQKYPHWEFRAFFPRVQGGGTVNWNTALAQQSRIGTSMVPIGSTNAFKSFDPKTYDFTRNSWYHLDRGWTGASPEAVAYYLDPRNFLDEQSIFMFESLAYDSEFHTLASVRQALSGTFMGNTTKYDGVDENGASVSLDHAEMFMRAAQYSGASPVFLAQRSVYELGTSGSGSVSGNYKSSKYPNIDFTGIRNYYNIGASSDPSDPIGNGLHFALTNTNPTFLLPWNSRYRAIVGGARWISDGYIRANQHTLYLQKFDLDFDARYGAYWHQYMTNLNAPRGEASRVYNTYKNRGELSSPFVFHIPVMTNMPASRAPYPSDNRNRNNYLSSLTVEGATLSPAFNPQVHEYTATFPDDVLSTVVSAKAYHATAKVDRVGGYAVPPGETKISVSVTSERGDLRVYQITLKRSASGPPLPTDPVTPTTSPTTPALSVSSSALQVTDNYLSGFNVQTENNKVQNLASLISYTSGYRMEVRNKDNAVMTEGNIGTGFKVHFYASGQTSPVRTLTVIIYGDANGDGRVNSIDMHAVFEQRMGDINAVEPFLTAMDVNRDGRINSIDMHAIFEDRMGIRLIQQNRDE